MVTGIVSRETNSFGTGIINGGNSAAQVFVGNPLPGRLSRANKRLKLDTGAVAPPAGHRKVEPATNGIEGLIGQTPCHLQYKLNCRVAATCDNHQPLIFDMRQQRLFLCKA